MGVPQDFAPPARALAAALLVLHLWEVQLSKTAAICCINERAHASHLLYTFANNTRHILVQFNFRCTSQGFAGTFIELILLNKCLHLLRLASTRPSSQS